MTYDFVKGFRKTAMGIIAMGILAASTKLGMDSTAIMFVGAVAIIAVGGTAVVDAFVAYYSGRPFVFRKEEENENSGTLPK